jgi:hypothetical protein
MKHVHTKHIRTNTQRARLAHMALKPYVNGAADEADALIDLLVDLMHYAETAELDFGRSIGLAKWHYTEETKRETQTT